MAAGSALVMKPSPGASTRIAVYFETKYAMFRYSFSCNLTVMKGQEEVVAPLAYIHKVNALKRKFKGRISVSFRPWSNGSL